MAEQAAPGRQRWRDLGFVLLCAGLLAAPLLGLSEHNFSPAMEKRAGAAAPRLPRSLADLRSLPADFEVYFNDRFGLRGAMLALRARALLGLFGISSSPRVVCGEDDWLFYDEFGSISDAQGLGAMAPADLEHWRDALMARHAALAARGIHYYFMVAANKESIYPEHLPARLHARPPSNLDRLLALFRQSQGSLPVWIIDTRPALIAAKPAGKLYYQLDVHWDPLGAYVAYGALGNALARDGVAHTALRFAPADFPVDARRGGDLVNLLGLLDYPRAELAPGFPPGNPACMARVPVANLGGRTGPDGSDEQSHCAGAADPGRVLILGDSMMEALRPYLSQSFRDIRFVRLYPQLPVVQAHATALAPAVVIEERIERKLNFQGGPADMTP